jgi:hypothetical protein
VKPGKQAILDDTFGAAHAGQQFVLWNAHHGEPGAAFGA